MNWTDESNGLVYVNWSAGEPVYKDDQNDCAYFSVSSGTWNTTNCDQRLHFVCEKGKNWSSKGISMLVFSSGGVGVGIGVRKIKTFPFLPIPFATPPFVRVERRSRRPNQLQRPEWSTVIGLFFRQPSVLPYQLNGSANDQHFTQLIIMIQSRDHEYTFLDKAKNINVVECKQRITGFAFASKERTVYHSPIHLPRYLSMLLYAAMLNSL